MKPPVKPRVVTFKIPEWLLASIDLLVEDLRGERPDLSRSDLLRVAVLRVLRNPPEDYELSEASFLLNPRSVRLAPRREEVVAA